MEAIKTREMSAAEALLKLALREDVRTHARAMGEGAKVAPERRPFDAKAQEEWEARMY